MVLLVPVAQTDTYQLTDRLIDGGLPAFLAAARSAGESAETIAYRLRSEHEIVVSSETVRRWIIRAALAPSETAAP